MHLGVLPRLRALLFCAGRRAPVWALMSPASVTSDPFEGPLPFALPLFPLVAGLPGRSPLQVTITEAWNCWVRACKEVVCFQVESQRWASLQALSQYLVLTIPKGSVVGGLCGVEPASVHLIRTVLGDLIF